MDTNSPVLNTLGDNAKKAKINTARAVAQETKRVADSTANQISSAPLTEDQKKATRAEVEGLYGGKESLMDEKTYQKKHAEDQKRTAGLLEQILGQLLGPPHIMKDDRKEKVASEHKKAAEELGQVQDKKKEQEDAQKKQLEEQEAQKKKEEQKAKLENQIEAPAGKQTGILFKRKSNTPRMRPPTAETRGGKGNRE